ncbi:MAG: ATP-binding protein [Chloroflexota bacterium]|nr:ATP-binding protein [Dehalococcoidia bacterium]MDW8254920.1 ATP-binding protein [Chloroflexota bacterium]
MAAAPQFETPVDLNRERFLQQLITGLGYLHESMLGSEVAGAYIMTVGLSMGAAIEESYKQFWGIDRPLTREEYAHVIVDLKQKIGGNFSLVSLDDDKVVVQTTSCPFDQIVRRSPSLCFMTSSVFGGIAARNFGYAKVVLHRRIALGDPGCLVTIYLKRTPEAEAAVGKEYAPDTERASPDIAVQLRLMDRIRQLRHALAESEARWEAVAHGAVEAIGVLDRAGRLVYANPSWRDLLGVEAGELVGDRLDRVAHPEDQARLAAALARAGAGERVVAESYRLRHRSGSYREVDLSAGPLRDEAGQLSGAVVVLHDVTDERQAARMKEHLLAAASHEMRTPLASIRANAELLKRSLQHPAAISAERFGRAVDIILREADRLTAFGADLVDAARAREGSLRLTRERFDLRTVLDEVASPPAFGGAAAPTVAVTAPEAPVWVNADRRRLHQALDNLVANARKFSRPDQPVQVSVAESADTIVLRVRDSGIGIPASDLPLLTTPFFRASNAAASYPGLGLGLFLSRAIVEAHGGTLTVESVEGRGTTVTITLPREAG